MNYLIGLDIGTSSVKGVLMSTEGAVVKTAHGTFKYTKLENGGVEIDADKFVDVCISAIKELSVEADGEIKGICASSASGNLVVLDKKNKPLTPIFNWQDTRATTEVGEILGEYDAEEIYKKVGWPVFINSFPLALLCYIKKHSPKILENCGKVCMSTEYLYYKLTGKWGISPSAGTPFYLIDQQTGKYIPEILDIFGISEDNLPPVMPCGTKLGEVTTDASKKSGLPEGTLVVLGSFDHPSAARGVGVFDEGEMLLSCGTSWVALFPIKERSIAIENKMLADPFLSEKGGNWATMVSVASLSERIKLYTERYIDNSEESYKVLAELAEKSKSGANELKICLLEEPDDNAIKLCKKEDIARAIMEGAVSLLKEKIDNVRDIGIAPRTAVMVGGPSENPMYRKIIEEMCGITVRVLHGENAGAVGAAKLAGIGAGIYKDERDAHIVCEGKGQKNV